jgi:hypothetical protein
MRLAAFGDPQNAFDEPRLQAESTPSFAGYRLLFAPCYLC